MNAPERRGLVSDGALAAADGTPAAAGGTPAAAGREASGASGAPRGSGVHRPVFLVMSSTTPAASVAQLVRALAPYPVVVHHDFGQRPDFRLDEPNVLMVPESRPMGWNAWTFTLAMLHAMRYCVEHVPFGWLQLMNPNALPVRPVAEYVEATRAAHVDALMQPLDLSTDLVAKLAYSYRIYAPRDSFAYRLMWRLCRACFPPGTRHVVRSGLEVPVDVARRASGDPVLAVPLSRAVLRAVRSGLFGAHPFGSALKPMIGDPWLGATPDVVHYLLRRAETPSLQAWFRTMDQRDEVLFPTLLGNSAYRLGPSPIWLAGFGGTDRTRTLTEADLETAAQAGAFFARRFPPEPDSPVRRAALARAGVVLEPPR